MDLWPKDIGSSTLKSKSPAAILKEQASVLGEKTNNIVTAEVRRGEASEGKLSYSFYLTSKPLNYRYKLFKIIYSLDNPYPVDFVEAEEEIEKVLSEYLAKKPALVTVPPCPEAKSEEEFLNILGKIFNAEKTKRIVNSLIAESEV